MGIANYWEKPGRGTVDEKGNRTYVRKWIVEMQYFDDVPPNVWGTGFADIPRYSSYPEDEEALALSLDCNPMGENVGFYEVEITYKSQAFDEGNTALDPSETDQSTSPPDRPWVIKFGANHSTRLLGPQDIAGVSVANSAGQPFDPPPEVPCSNLTITITAYKDISWGGAGSNVFTYQDSINNASFTLGVTPTVNAAFPQYTVRCTDYNTEIHNENGDYYWQANLVLEYRVVPWHPLKVLDAGTCYIKSASFPPQPILDETGNPITHPIPLNGSGGILLAGGTLVYKSFQAYNFANFVAILS